MLAASCFFSCKTPGKGAKEINEKNVPLSKKYTVIIQQRKFAPAELTVNEDDTVIWVNQCILNHNVTEEINKNGLLVTCHGGIHGIWW